MKKKFSRILGVGLTLLMLTSLLVGVAPASANVSSASVTSTNLTISANGTYTAILQITAALTGGAGTISVEFPAGFDITNIGNVADDDGDTVVLGDIDDDVQVAATSGIGTVAFPLESSVSAINGVNTQQLDITVPQNIGVGATVQVQIGTGFGAVVPMQITNGPTPGDYVLKVSTSAETTAVDSASFTLAAPVVPPSPGIVAVINDGGVPMSNQTGPTAIALAIAAVGANTGWTISIGPGTYAETPTTGAATTTFVAGTPGTAIITGLFTVAHAGTVLDGLTLSGGVTVGANSTVQNSTISNAAGDAFIVTAATAAVSTGNTISASAGNNGLNVNAGQTATSTGDSFTPAATGTAIANSGTLTVTGATITGASGTGVMTAAGSTTTITGSSLSGLTTALNIADGLVTATGNTIDASGPAAATEGQAAIYVAASTGAGVQITDNTISNSPEDILEVDANANNVFVNFNTLTGNTGAFNNDGAGTLDARNNWWGDATGPAVASAGTVATTPWLVSPVSSPSVVLGGTTLTSTAAGVTVAATAAVDIIGIASYAGNPVAGSPTLNDAIKWFDVYVSSPVLGAPATVTVTVSGITSPLAAVWAWSASQQTWVNTGGLVDLFAGTVIVNLTAATSPSIANLAALEFTLTEPSPPVIAPIAAPAALTLPAMGAVDVSLTPSFSWAPVAGAIGYEWELTEYTGGGNPFIPSLLVVPTAEPPAPGIIHLTPPLQYNNTYSWRVRAVRGVDDYSAWVQSFFTTMKEPVSEPEAPPPIIIEQQDPPPAPQITLTIPAAPAPVNVIPESLLWIVIAVGAVLVIAVIILIVRTRRVA